MSEPYAIHHFCKCEKPKLGYISGDTETVYCDYCEGVLGSLGDMHLEKLNEQEQLDNIQAQADKTGEKVIENIIDAVIIGLCLSVTFILGFIYGKLI